MSELAFYHRLRELREHFMPPPGATYPEISGGAFVMTMSPCRPHRITAADLRDQLASQVQDGAGVVEAADIRDDALGKLRIADLVVTDGEAVPPLAIELGTWKLDTSGLPLYSRKDMMLPPE